MFRAISVFKNLNLDLFYFSLHNENIITDQQTDK